MGPVGQEVDDRHVDAPGVEGVPHAHEGAVVHDPGTQHPVEAGQGAGHVLGRLAHVDAHFCALYVDRVPAEGDGRHL